jgi:hypothetical protein
MKSLIAKQMLITKHQKVNFSKTKSKYESKNQIYKQRQNITK